MQDPNEDTEWNDALRRFGIIPPKEEPSDEVEEMVLRLQEEAKVKPFERMNLAGLKEAEDEFVEEDEHAIEIYRRQRLAEWQVVQKKSKFGELAELQGDEYVKQITYAGDGIWVILHLYRPGAGMEASKHRCNKDKFRRESQTKGCDDIINTRLFRSIL